VNYSHFSQYAQILPADRRAPGEKYQKLVYLESLNHHQEGHVMRTDRVDAAVRRVLPGWVNRRSALPDPEMENGQPNADFSLTTGIFRSMRKRMMVLKVRPGHRSETDITATATI
jgi:hypothetical protein